MNTEIENKKEEQLYPWAFFLSIFPFSVWMMFYGDSVFYSLFGAVFAVYSLYRWTNAIFNQKAIPKVNLVLIILLFSLLLSVKDIGNMFGIPETYQSINSEKHEVVNEIENNNYRILFSKDENLINDTRILLDLNNGSSSLFEVIYAINPPSQFFSENLNTFIFKEDSIIDKACYFSGIAFSLNSKMVGESIHGTMTTLFRFVDEYPRPFEWVCTSFPKTKVKKVFLYSSSMDTQEAGEVVFYNEGKRVFPLKGAKLLIDESYLEPDPNVGYKGRMVFDEIYHARAGYEFLRNLEPYENTHPPLGKLFIELGISTFGFSPFGWRIMSAIFGMLGVLIAYFFGRELTGSKTLGVFAALIFESSLMHLVFSRVGLIDIFGTTLTLLYFLMFFMFVKYGKVRYLFLTGIFLGLAAGVKWSALFGSIGILAIGIILLFRKNNSFSFSKKKLVFFSIISFFILMPAAYLSTFLQYIISYDFSFADIVNYNLQAYDYHTHEATPHMASSTLSQWLANSAGVPLFMEENVFGSSFLVITESSLLSYTALVSIIAVAFFSVKNKDIPSMVVPAAYISLILPYVFIGRTLYLYHYSYSLFFAMISIVLFYSYVARNSKAKIFASILLILFVLTSQVHMLKLQSPITGGKIDTVPVPKDLGEIYSKGTHAT